MDAILGKNVLIQFYKTDGFYDYACASNISIHPTMETKSVKTVGDGFYRKRRGQTIDYEIQLDGIISIDDSIKPNAFDLLDYLNNMTDIQFRMMFEDSLNNLKVIEGSGLPVDVNLGGGSEGHASGSAVLAVNGLPDIRNTITACDLVITGFTIVKGLTGHYTATVTSYTGSNWLRWDYSVDGGGRLSSYSNTWQVLIDPLATGTHTIDVYPVCQNGFDGSVYSTTFHNP